MSTKKWGDYLPTWKTIKSRWVPKALRCITSVFVHMMKISGAICLIYFPVYIFFILWKHLLSHCLLCRKILPYRRDHYATGIKILCASSSGPIYKDIWRPYWYTSSPRFLTYGHSTINMPGLTYITGNTCSGLVYIDTPGHHLCHCPMEIDKLPHRGPSYSNNSEARHDNLASACTGWFNGQGTQIVATRVYLQRPTGMNHRLNYQRKSYGVIYNPP